MIKNQDKSTVEHTNIRGTKKAKRFLRRIAALTDEKQYEVLERVLEKELKEKELGKEQIA